jgi:hypothetical protein
MNRLDGVILETFLIKELNFDIFMRVLPLANFRVAFRLAEPLRFFGGFRLNKVRLSFNLFLGTIAE